MYQQFCDRCTCLRLSEGRELLDLCHKRYHCHELHFKSEVVLVDACSRCTISTPNLHEGVKGREEGGGELFMSRRASQQ